MNKKMKMESILRNCSKKFFPLVAANEKFM